MTYTNHPRIYHLNCTNAPSANDFRTTGCLAISVTSETPLFSDIYRRSRLFFHVLNGHWGGFDFLKKKIKIFARIFFYGCVRQKLIFAGFWAGLTDCVADCSAPCGPIRLKFYVVNGLGYGYWWWKFCWGTLRYAVVAAEKLVKTVKNQPGPKTAKIVGFWWFFNCCARVPPHAPTKFASSVAIP